MENSWFIKVHRKILKSEIWKKPPEWLKIWIYLLITVNWKDNWSIWNWKFTYKQIQENCNVTRNQTDSFIRWAKTAWNISTEKTKLGLVVYISNYSQYQSLNFDTNPTLKPKLTRHSTDTQPTPLPYIEELRIKKEIIIIEKKSELEKLIEEFYIYRKKDKKDEMWELAKKIFLDKLEKLSWWDENHKIALIKNAIDRSWKTIFPLSTEKQNIDRKQAMANYNIT